MSIRKCAVAGSFYPAQKEEVLRYIEHFSQELNNIRIDKNIQALVVPHAGYIYSGFTANLAYHLAKDLKPKRVIVIGPSHKVYIQGASVSLHESYETPLGDMDVDIDFSNKLKENFGFLTFDESVHSEHSTETQVPFIKHYFNDSAVVEIIYGKQDYNALSKLIEYCMEDKDNLIVISTDLSHFYSLKEANLLDEQCLSSVIKKDIKGFDGCEACGMIGVKALVDVAIHKGLNFELLNYCTSYDRTSDDSSVVGYCSFILGD